MSDPSTGLAAYRRGLPPTPAEYSATVRAVACPSCDAGPGELCRNSWTGQPLREVIPGHPARAAAAAAIATPPDPA